MYFTREPVIETVITPREGCKLVVRSSKGGREDYFVDAVEVVSFGNSFFFRSLERPKSFLLPVSDYEVIELKETRMVLKTATSEKSIKIAPKSETSKEEDKGGEKAPERKKKRYRSRKRGPSSHRKEITEAPSQEKKEGEKASESTENNAPENSTKVSFLKKLFPPPLTLIKEKLNKENGVGKEEAKVETETKPVKPEPKKEEIPTPLVTGPATSDKE